MIQLEMSKATDFLEAQKSSTPSHWREDAQWRQDNEYWLTYSRNITLQVLQAMEQQSVTQVELARRMGCSQQYVSNLLKGSSNMTLETIGRLEKALNLDILKSALGYVSGYNPSVRTPSAQYLSEPLYSEETVVSGTAALVDGFAKGKKKTKKI